MFYNHLQRSTLGFACPFNPGTGCQTTATDMRHMTKAFIDFMYVLFMQIFEWCNYVKMTGLMKSTLPFELPLNVDESSAKSVIEKEFILCNEDLRHMEYVYREEVPELQSVPNGARKSSQGS